MKSMFNRPLIWLSSLLVIASLACNLSGAATTEAPPATQEPVSLPTKPPVEAPTATTEVKSGAVGDLDGVKSAVVQIVAEGSFLDPGEWNLNVGSSGTGFIIDPSGIAVTNNHVVTGAAFFKVYVGGDLDKAYDAKVLGVSECSDLAVIDIEGDGFPYLDWYTGEVKVGLDVYAAGFPFGDPEYTLTEGIVAKAQTSGDTVWASVKQVIQHTAKINPGNSGGPLVTKDGQVVAVNYAGVTEMADQNFAIMRDAALPVLEQLRSGKDVDSIGVNGVTLAGLLAQENAAILAHIALAQIFRPGTPVLYGTVSTIANMRLGTVALGAVETGLITAASAQLAHRYGIPIRSVGGTTEAKTGDLQAGAERMATLLPAVLSGVNYITCAGTLDSSMLESDALLVMDDELAGMALRVKRGIEVNETTMAMDVIRKVGFSSNYITEKHTMQNFRKEHFLPRFMVRQPHESWVTEGSKSALENAREKAREILANHQPRQLDPAIEEELEAYRKMVAERPMEELYKYEAPEGQDFRSEAL